MLRFDKVSYKNILKNLNFEIKSGEMVAIMGASGAGKSTVFRLLIGEFLPSIGNIFVDNYNLDQLSFAGMQQYRRHIGVVFQDFRLLNEKTVFENVALPLEIQKKTPLEIEKKVLASLKIVGMEDHLYDFPTTLSGGEMQRIAIARAVVHAPKVIIADEPTGNLDRGNSAQIAKIFQFLNQQGFTILFSTHDEFFVECMNPRVLKLQNGKIINA